MTRSTTASATSAEDSKTTVERRWMSVVFLQGEEADTVLDMIERVGPEPAIHHLSQWDYGEETRDTALVNGYVYDEIPQIATDRVFHDDASAHALMYNHEFGYVSLLRHFTPVVEDGPQLVAQQYWLPAARHGTARRTDVLRL